MTQQRDDPVALRQVGERMISRMVNLLVETENSSDPGYYLAFFNTQVEGVAQMPDRMIAAQLTAAMYMLADYKKADCPGCGHTMHEGICHCGHV